MGLVRKLREWSGDGSTGGCVGFASGFSGRQLGNEASYARSAFRNFGDPDYRFNLFGFRPARSSVP